MALIGYARVSTVDQNLDLQLDALKGAGCDAGHVYQEKMSGKKADRPELQHCLKALRPGDILVVWRLDRLGRSVADLVNILATLDAQGVGFRSVTEALDSTTAAGRMHCQLLAVLAEFERNLTQERTKAGLAAARARGRVGGRPPALTPAQVIEVQALMRDPQVDVTSVTKRYGVSRATLYKYAPGGAGGGKKEFALVESL